MNTETFLYLSSFLLRRCVVWLCSSFFNGEVTTSAPIMTVRFSVAHGLDAGQRGAAGSEGSQDKEHCHIPRRFDDRRRLRRLLPEHEHTHKARHDERKDSEDEEIRGHAEHDR